MVDPIVTPPHPPVTTPQPLPPTVALNPPMVGTASPFERVDGQNRDLILEAIRAWARGPLFDWAGAWHRDLITWLDDTDNWLDSWNDEVVRYVQDVLNAVINNSIELQDPVLAIILRDPDALTHIAMRDVVADIRGVVTDVDYPSLDEAYAATPTGSILEIRREHERDVPFTIDRQVTVRFAGAGHIAFTGGRNELGLVVSADDVRLESPSLSGFGTDIVGTGAGISATDVTGLHITNPQLRDWTMHAIVLTRVTDFTVEGGLILDCGYSGVMLLSCARGVVRGVHVKNIIQQGAWTNTYGFAATRLQNDSIATSPLTSDIDFIECIAEGVTKWEGFDTHGGVRISFINCRAIDCYHGFAIVGCPDDFGGTPGWAAKDILIQGCIADSTVSDGTRGAGLQFAGVNATPGVAHDYATGKIMGLTIIGHGRTDNAMQGGTYIHTTRGLQINGLSAFECSPHGVVFNHTNKDFVATNIVVVDPWKAAPTGDAPAGVGFRSDHNEGTLSNVMIYTAGKVATQTLTYGVRNWQNSPDTAISLAQITVKGASVADLQNAGNRMGYRIDGSVGFFGTQPTTRIAIAGSRGGNAALTNLLNALESYGLIVNSTIE